MLLFKQSHVRGIPHQCTGSYMASSQQVNDASSELSRGADNQDRSVIVHLRFVRHGCQKEANSRLRARAGGFDAWPILNIMASCSGLSINPQAERHF